MGFTYFLWMSEDNIAAIFGGGIELYKFNNAFMLRCIFSSKTAVWVCSITIWALWCIFFITILLLDNNAADGGALYAYKDNQATIVDSILSSNLTPWSARSTVTHGVLGRLLINDCFVDNLGEYNTKYGRGLYLHDTSNVLNVKNTSVSSSYSSNSLSFLLP